MKGSGFVDHCNGSITEFYLYFRTAHFIGNSLWNKLTFFIVSFSLINYAALPLPSGLLGIHELD